MSAVLRDPARLGRMAESDLDEVAAIESAVYSHPWTRRNFADSLRAGYQCRTWRVDGALAGYLVLLVSAGEAHLLNLSVAAQWQRRGHGSALLGEAIGLAKSGGARRLLLEVRPSNVAAHGLYSRFGFRHLGVRRDYYPVHGGREDARVLELVL